MKKKKTKWGREKPEGKEVKTNMKESGEKINKVNDWQRWKR
jgi:hypothetical protein